MEDNTQVGKVIPILTSMMANSLNVALVLLLHCGDEVRRSWVVAAGKQEVLPYEDALSVTDLVKVIRLDNTAAPHSDLSFISNLFQTKPKSSYLPVKKRNITIP
jgi:hypothetical protein